MLYKRDRNSQVAKRSSSKFAQSFDDALLSGEPGQGVQCVGTEGGEGGWRENRRRGASSRGEAWSGEKHPREFIVQIMRDRDGKRPSAHVLE